MSAFIYFGLFLLLSWCHTEAAAGDEYCKQLNASVGPALPNVTGSTFQTDIEVNVMSEGYMYTLEIEEYFDSRNRREMMLMHAPLQMGGSSHVVFRYDDQQVYVIKNSYDCQVFNISRQPNLGLFQDLALHGTVKWGSVHASLRIGDHEDAEYIDDTSMIRGILCNHWKQCIHWAELNTSFTADYYFSARNWSHSVVGSSPVPVRIVIKGSRGNSVFEFYVEFLSYRPLIVGKNSKLFQVPDNVYCKGETNKKKIPELPDQYSYRSEFVLSSYGGSFNLIQNRDVWFDFTDQLIRVDYRVPFARYSKFNTNPVSEVQDFKTGVRYVIDKVLGNCTALGFDNSTSTAALDPYQLHADNVRVFRMKDAMELFSLTDEYIYIGQDTVRGIRCDVFIAEIPYEPAGKGTSRFEYYFTADNWFEEDIAAQDQPLNVPIKLRITNKNGYNLELNFYDFSTESIDPNIFSISNCYASEAKKRISIEFPGIHYGVVQKNPSTFLDKVRGNLISSGSLSKLRIQDMALDYLAQNDKIYVSFILLQQPPITAQFDFGRRMIDINPPDVTYTNVSTFADCMEICSEEPGISCNGLDHCPQIQGGRCALYETHGGSKDLAPNDTCVHFSRLVNADPLQQMTLLQAWADIKNAVFEGGFKVEMEDPNARNVKEFVAWTINDESWTGSGAQQPSHFMSAFDQAIKGKNLLPEVSRPPVNTVASVDECARLCLEDTQNDCLSFSFCSRDQATCLLSSIHPKKNPKKMTEATDCNVYPRHFLDFFEKTPGIVGLTVDSTYPICFNDAENCAQECVISDNVDCKSFYYCYSISATDPTCFLSENRHPGPSNPSYGLSNRCSFYSRQYGRDFVKQGDPVVMRITNGIVLSDLSFGQCLEKCVETQGQDGCTDLYHCSGSENPICYIEMPGYNYKGTKEIKAKCQHFIRPGKSRASKATAEPKTQDGFTSSSMIALAIGMFVAGAITGAVLLYAINRKRMHRASKEDQMALHDTSMADSTRSTRT